MNAVESALHQSLNREEFEIIVIKNFVDSSIDKFLEVHKIRNIITSLNTTGEWFEIALNNSKGDVITFLDDDDLYVQNKLEIVKEMFSKYSNLIYLHNNSKKFYSTNQDINTYERGILQNIINIDINTRSGFIQALRKNYFQNLSAISIRREVLEKGIEYIKQTNHGTDMVIFISSLNIGGLRFHIDACLSLYMIHQESHTNSPKGDLLEFQNKRKITIPYYINDFYLLFNMVENNHAKHYLEIRTFTSKIWLDLISEKRTRFFFVQEIFKILPYIRYYRQSVFFILIYPLYTIFPTATKHLYFIFLDTNLGWRLRSPA